MERNVDITEISDGKFYTSNDMARADCNDCQGCHACCEGMGDTIKLDPYDVWQLKKNLNASFEELLAQYIELHVAEGIILPNVKMNENTNQCVFLNKEGRCSIHDFRPGFCRLFPLGRIYEDHSFKYFVLRDECAKKNRTKVKIKKWLDVPELPKYEKFINEWHYFFKRLSALEQSTDTPEFAHKVNMEVIREFYLKDYKIDFYTEVSERINNMTKQDGILSK